MTFNGKFHDNKDSNVLTVGLLLWSDYEYQSKIKYISMEYHMWVIVKLRGFHSNTWEKNDS